MGVQLSSPPNLSSVHSKDIWDLFKDEFPYPEDQMPMEPSFETFGGMPAQQTFEFGPPPVHRRLWLVSEDQNHLLQVQRDRFILNWRKRPNGSEYPRFEKIISVFEKRLSQFETYYKEGFQNPFSINQAEISYHNLIHVDEFKDVPQWLSFFDDRGRDVESFNSSFSTAIKDEAGRGFARLVCQVGTVFIPPKNEKAVKLILTFRGSPSGDSCEDALSFIKDGREMIMNRFVQLTTDEAKEKWGME